MRWDKSFTIERVMEQAGVWQDEGFEICFLIPTTNYLDAVYPFMVHELDMSRVICFIQGQLELARAEHFYDGMKIIALSALQWDPERYAFLLSLNPDLIWA